MFVSFCKCLSNDKELNQLKCKPTIKITYIDLLKVYISSIFDINSTLSMSAAHEDK